MVGALLVREGKVIGRGWHRRAGGPHAEIEALRDARKRGESPRGATLYVTLEPCSTHGRTPPCTDAIIAAGIRRVVLGATDPNPKHRGRAFGILRRAGISVEGITASRGWGKAPDERSLGSRGRSPHQGLAADCERLNEAHNHWIVRRTPFVTVKAAMTLDGKIATASGESKWITNAQAREFGMKLRRGADAILVGVNTVLADDPSLTIRRVKKATLDPPMPGLRRIVLDSMARTPLDAKVVSDEHAALTMVVVGRRAPQKRVASLANRVHVMVAPERKSQISNFKSQINLPWLLKKLGAEGVTSLLVEGGGEVNASFLLGGLAHRVAFFYAPKIIGGRNCRPAVAGEGAAGLAGAVNLADIRWRRLGPDLLLTARVAGA